MKKFIQILLIVSIFVFVGIVQVSAQVNIQISWSSECPHTCTTQEDCNRVFVYTIYEVCGESQELVCSDTTTYNCETSTPVTVQCDYDCSGSHVDLCFLIRVDAYKVCIGPGGPNTICHGTGSGQAESCFDLMDGTNVPITWQ